MVKVVGQPLRPLGANPFVREDVLAYAKIDISAVGTAVRSFL